MNGFEQTSSEFERALLSIKIVALHITYTSAFESGVDFSKLPHLRTLYNLSFG